MGLFSWISSAFRGRSARSTAESRGLRPVTGGQDGRSAQSHGSHWDVVVPDRGRETAIQGLAMQAVREGEVVDGEVEQGSPVRGHRSGTGPLGTLAVTIDDRIATSYPVAEGVEHPLDVRSLSEWETGIEAWARGRLEDEECTVFATNYFQRPERDFDGSRRVSIALLLYAVAPAASDAIAGQVDQSFDRRQTTCFQPWERGGPDDYLVRTTVDAVETVAHGGYEAYRMDAPLFETDDGDAVNVSLYAGDHVAGRYDPGPGDRIDGAGWLQAWFH